MKMPAVKQDFYPMGGGLDMLTPAIALEPGKVFDCQNYEPEISGGYRRIDGYERFDGRPSPSAAIYYVMGITLTGAIAVGNTVTGATSGATGKCLALDTGNTNLVLGRVTGTFISGENLQVAAATQAVSTTVALQQGAGSPSDDADYTLLAANDIRSDIQKVPGSGQIRGVWVFNDVVYAFRDNVGGTAGAMYKHTSGGWVLVSFGTEISFSSTMGGTTPIAVGDTIGNLGAAPTKTATVVAVLTRKGTWGTDAVGTLIITPLTGSFANADPIFVGATQKAVATSAATAITRAPGGQLEFVNANFTGSTATLKMYGADGVNPAFEFDGTNYIPIHTGMTADTPTHICAHRNYLFLSFLGSVQYSGLGNPYAWTVVLGAGEIALGDYVTGFLPQGGNASGSSMAIFTKIRTHILYGSSAANFQLVTSIYDLGYSSLTMQPVSNNTYGLTARGIQGLITTLTYGDFDYASISHLVQPFISSKRGMETCSSSSRLKDQYRLYFNDGYGIIVGLTGDNVNGLMLLNYGRPVRCICTQTLSSGLEVTYFGSDDGYIYKDNIGTSFDGAVIESWIRPAFNNLKSPRLRKRYRRATFEVKVTGYATVNVTYDLGYGNPDVNQMATRPDTEMTGNGGYWDGFYWESFQWDTKVFADPSISIEGTEKNISFFFYSSRAQDKSHTIQGVTLMYTPRRLER